MTAYQQKLKMIKYLDFCGFEVLLQGELQCWYCHLEMRGEE